MKLFEISLHVSFYACIWEKQTKIAFMLGRIVDKLVYSVSSPKNGYKIICFQSLFRVIYRQKGLLHHNKVTMKLIYRHKIVKLKLSIC